MRRFLFAFAATLAALIANSAPASAAVADDWTALRREADNLGKPAWHPMLRYLAALHERATHPAAEPFAFDWEEIGPGYGYGPAFGHWDIVHEMLDVLPARPAHVRRQLLNDLRLQLDDGFLPGSIYMPGARAAPGGVATEKTKATFDRGTQSHPPLWVVAAGDYLALAPDAALMRECFDRVTRQIGWFESARRAAPDGFFYNDILLHKWESGVDEGVRFDNTTTGAKPCIDATCHVYQLCDYAARWAQQLGLDEKPWRERADRLAAFIREKLWDDASGFFYDRWAIENPALRTAAFEGMWPVVTGAATPAQARRVIDEWLLNPRRFFAAHPIATVGVDDPKFSNRMWRGPAWNSMTYWAARGCVRYGRPDAARAARRRTRRYRGAIRTHRHDLGILFSQRRPPRGAYAQAADETQPAVVRLSRPQSALRHGPTVATVRSHPVEVMPGVSPADFPEAPR